jgi:hypothetical protein
MARRTVVFEDYSLTEYRTYSDGKEWRLERYTKFSDGHAVRREVATFTEKKLARETYENLGLRVEAI